MADVSPRRTEIESNCNGTECSQPQIHLPIEIVIYIMEFLPLADRISASQVCRAWYEASQDQKLHKKEIVVIQDNLTRPLDCLLASTGTFINFLFREVELNTKIMPFWDRFCPHIQYLGLYSCILTERMFVDILSRCCHLESLIINNCRELLMTGRVLETESDVLLLQRTLIKLRELSITYNRYMSDAIFFRFVSIAPNLQELELTGCQISYHMGLYKKFYPSSMVDEGNFILSETVFTFNVILRYIREQAKKIKVLKFGRTFIDNSALSQLAKVPGLNLRALHLQSCDQLTNTGLTDLVSYQKSLTYLDLSGCSRLTDHALIAICHNLTNLQSLNIRNCRAITNIGIGELSRLEQLQCLNLAQCEMVTGEGVVSGLCLKVNKQLQKLNLCALLMDEESLCKVAENLPCLQLLDLSWCFNAVTDRSMQAICTHLLLLNTLKLASCDKVSDAGVTGTNDESEADCELEDALEDSQFLDDEFPDPLHKISLRSRAEREIVSDAKRKSAVFRKCAKNQKFEGMSLERIHGLQHLDLSGCNRITDVGLVYALRFPELRHVDLSRCQQITRIGLSALAQSNPSLETLVMNDCFNITDEAILSVVKCLKRLKHLDIQGCKHLTDASLQAMSQYCFSLQYLNVNNCIGMSMTAALLLEKKINTLRTLHHSGLKADQSPNSDNEIRFEQQPPPPPPPPGKKSIFVCFLR